MSALKDLQMELMYMKKDFKWEKMNGEKINPGVLLSINTYIEALQFIERLLRCQKLSKKCLTNWAMIWLLG